MPKVMKLSKNSIGIVIPKQLAKSANIKAGDYFEMEIKSVDPLILRLIKLKKIEW